MKKKYIYFMIFMLITLINPSTIEAKEVRLENDLSSTIEILEEKDTLILEDKVYKGNFKIDKELTIKGSNKTVIEGSLIISSNVNLENLQIKTPSNNSYGINVIKKSNINIDNVSITYDSLKENDYGFKDYYSAIVLTKSANFSTLNIINSNINAAYGIWINGSGNNLTINKTNFTSNIALDITNGSSAKELAVNNSIVVENSKLQGVSTNTQASVINIGGQDNLTLNILNSTIENKLINDNIIDLIVYPPKYLPSKNVDIKLENSKLFNTAVKNQSAVINYNNTEVQELSSNNKLEMINNSIKTENNNIILTTKDYIFLKIVKGNTAKIYTMKKNTKFDKNLISKEEIENIFLDKSYTNLFDINTDIKDNTTIYINADSDKLIKKAKSFLNNLANSEKFNDFIKWVKSLL